MSSENEQTSKEDATREHPSSGFKFFSRFFSILIFLGWSSGLGAIHKYFLAFINSAFKIEPPAAPLMVLWTKQVNL